MERHSGSHTLQAGGLQAGGLQRSAPLLIGSAWAVAAALLGREAGLLPACFVAVAAVGMCWWRGRAGPWIWALPAAFAASAPPQPCLWTRAGPVWIEGEVLTGIRVDPLRGDVSFRLMHDGQVFLCVVASASRAFRVLPGDRIRGPGRVSSQIERRRQSRMPRVITTEDALRVHPGGPGLWRLAAWCRLSMQDTLLRRVDGEAGVLLCHLVLGTGPELSSDLVSAHRATGLSHLLAVSGAHLTMLGWLLGMAFASATRRSPLQSRWFRRGCGLVLCFYGVITGMEPPVFRATLAALVFLIGCDRGRTVPVASVLALPAMFTAVLVPEDLFGVSFNLSYAAVIGLSLSGGIHGSTVWQRWVRGPLECSLWASLCTTPLTLWYFGQFAPWTILATPILSPVVAAMLGTSLLAACSAPLVPWLTAGMAWIAGLLTVVYSAAVRALAELPCTPIHSVSRPDTIVLCLSAAVGLVVIGIVVKGGLVTWWRDRRSVAVLCIVSIVPHFLPPRELPAPGLRLLAVGHGHAGLITTDDGVTVLVDCGSLGHARRAARVAAEALLPWRILDHLVVTHGDADHTGGIVPLLDRIRVTRALLPSEMADSVEDRALRKHGCDVRYLASGEQLRLTPGILVHRPGRQTRNTNDQSAWLTVDWTSFRAILTGDALASSTEDWLASDLACAADVLVLPHHGRANAAAARLLDRVRPGLALVSTSASDGESAQTEAARAARSEVLHTGLVGTIHVLATSPPTVHTERPRRLTPSPPLGGR